MPAYPAAISLAELNGSNGFRVDGQTAGEQFGVAVSAAGDLNGDGIGDIIVGSALLDPRGRVDAGASYVIYGKTGGWGPLFDISSLNGRNGFRIDGAAAGEGSSSSVSSAGDVNGDGRDDLIIGAYAANGETGSAYVLYGKATGQSATVDLATLTAANGFRINGAAPGDWTGQPVSAAGDVNGDGYADVVIGAQFADPDGRTDAGSAYVIYGDRTSPASPVNLATLAAADGFRLDGATAGDLAGIGVASAGDFNGDGFGDFIVGAPRVLRPAPGAADPVGAVYVVFGDASGAPPQSLADLPVGRGFQIIGPRVNSGFGVPVAGAGDVNGDGYDDIIVGAPEATADGVGAAYVLFGRAGVFPKTLDPTTLRGATGFRIEGVSVETNAGLSVDPAGDFNGDGFDDLLLGSPIANRESTGAYGSVFVVFGKAGGWDASISIDDLDGNNGLRIDGVLPDGRIGQFGSAAGDVNNDGLGDILINAQNASVNGAQSGSAYVVFGRLPQDDVTRIGSEIGQSIFGGAGDDHIDGRGGNDVLTSNAGDDELLGGAGHDKLTAGAGDDTLSGGSGNDALYGGDDRDLLYGGSGNDTLNGGFGGDRLEGGSGDDTYVIESLEDEIVEAGDSGTDRIITYVSVSLATKPNVENLTATGASAMTLTGSTGVNVIIGNGAVNVLNGGLGADTLTGLGGADYFLFANTLGSTNIDRITDFATVETIRLAKSVFAALPVGTLAAAAFKDLSVSAADASDRILYNKTTGALFYDADGSGAGAAQQFAILTNKAALTAADFVVVA